MLYEQFKEGINIGGWLSQYEFIVDNPLTVENLKQHFDTFITENDIKQISSWQFDHIRLPVSGYLLYDINNDCLNPDVLKYMHKCVVWCSKYHLNIIIDLHDIYGNVYGAMDEPMPLLTDTSLQNRFIRVWELLTHEFFNVTGTTIMFELLNEVSDASGAYPFSDVYGNSYDFSQKKHYFGINYTKSALKK